ncbi:MAG: prepilin-type N-terminal cleavage/methylation domain-containing protein [Patescibacteria group bacterium]
MKKNQYYTRGFGLVEVVVASAVLSVSLLGISTFFQATLRASNVTGSAIQGDYLLEEGIEVVKIFRDTNYTSNIFSLSTTTTYYFLWNGTNWERTTAVTLVDGKFERGFTISDVKRDLNNDIATSGTYDPETKLVNVFVSWWSPVVGTTTRSIQTYILNLFGN